MDHPFAFKKLFKFVLVISQYDNVCIMPMNGKMWLNIVHMRLICIFCSFLLFSIV